MQNRTNKKEKYYAGEIMESLMKHNPVGIKKYLVNHKAINEPLMKHNSLHLLQLMPKPGKTSSTML